MSESSHDSIAPAGARDCPNCGRERPESFCPQCGQSDRYYARSLGSVVVEFLREMFELDSRLFRTLKLLLFRPGSLTREFSRNRRVSFVSPVRLYIFASFAFFLLLSLVGDFGEMVVMGVTEEDREVVLPRPPTEEGLAAFRAALPPDQRRKVDDILGRSEDDFGRQTVLFAALEGDLEERSWIERLIVLTGIDILHDPSVVPRRLLANMPIAMFCLLPFLGLVLAAFHFRKKRFYVEHLVFAIHVQTFTFCVYAAALLLPDSGPAGWLRVGCLLIPYPYFVVALRRYYENGWILTLAKSVGVVMIYSLVRIPAFVISVFVTG
ncbi:DUF3667 domain-containing protein [Candidatus Palauibacter sp.]|uniref:DUF3667 domain-containing protein n=1 Tax=Candidatus Palauibacter sp. TaxID=3101350 RepID=UPI003B0233F5